jgi:hypothetical protein
MSETSVIGAAQPRKTAKPWYRQLWAHIVAAMIIGVLLGHFYPRLGEQMQPLGDGFIKAIRMLIGPIIFCTVVHGIAKMADMARVGRVAIKALIYFEVLTTIALIIGLVMVNLFQPGAGMNVDLSQVDTSSIKTYVAQSQGHDTSTLLLNIIPNTLVSAFAEGHVLQVLFVAVLCGFALIWMGERRMLRIAIGQYPHPTALRDGRVSFNLVMLEFADIPTINRAFAPMVREQRFDVVRSGSRPFSRRRRTANPWCCCQWCWGLLPRRWRGQTSGRGCRPVRSRGRGSAALKPGKDGQPHERGKRRG